MNFIVKQRNERIADAIFLIILGILMCIFQRATIEVFVLVSGISCIVFGCFFLLAYFWSFFVHSPSLLIRGVILLLVGSLILSFSNAYIYFLVFSVSIYLIYAGIKEMAYAINLSRAGVKNWWADLLNSIIDLGCGLAILIIQFTQKDASGLVCVLCGASLILYGVLELILIFLLHRDFKKKNKVVSEQ